MITLYTDGSARGNPGPGGYGTILAYNGHEKELSGGFRITTNNRMELLAVIKGLEALKKPNQEVLVYADSKYVVNAVMQGWLANWEKKDFYKKKNVDLWKRFLTVYRQHKVKLTWVRGHAGHLYNERCDQLATQAALKGPWGIDKGYESLQKAP
jgi:ribonuclease HI